jgi:hypothetical protein
VSAVAPQRTSSAQQWLNDAGAFIDLLQAGSDPHSLPPGLRQVTDDVTVVDSAERCSELGRRVTRSDKATARDSRRHGVRRMAGRAQSQCNGWGDCSEGTEISRDMEATSAIR